MSFAVKCCGAEQVCPQQSRAIELNIQGALSVIIVVILLLSSSLTDANELQPNISTSTCKPDPHSGIPGMPGVPGIPGTPGTPGRDGFKGEKGSTGKRGSRDAIGIPGKIGPRGPEGSKGEIGTKGSKGVPGNIGPRGPKGSKGENGTKGDKGDAGHMDPRQRANWKQCAWRGGTGTDNGKIKDCSFNKLYDNTALKVSYQGNIRILSDVACNRWYFKFNGNECSGPLPIESLLYTDWNGKIPNIHRHHSFEGYCENLPRGTVSVEVWVGKCHGQLNQGDAYTGWDIVVSRIMVEEVPPSQ